METFPNELFQETTTALSWCDEHLQFVTKVISRDHISLSIRASVEQHIQRIQLRRSDPNLYLAVIGEFSSGKSTFINALLRDDLLKTSALVATAVATRLDHSDNIQVEVSFRGSRPGKVKTKPNAKQITIPWLPVVNGIDTRQFIHLVTSNDDIAKEVIDLTISHPAAFLSNGIVIIDTPGTNATNPQHGQITRQVVENEADAAIIVIPATVPLSQTLVSFLAGSLRPYLHRCIFVVTRMDQISPREHSELLTNLRSRLVAHLAIKPPFLYACGAQIVIDCITGEEIIPQNLLVWQERFGKLESVILNRLQKERSRTITENVLRLLTRLFEQMEGQLRAQWEEYENHQLAIKREVIPDLPTLATEQHNICRQMLSDAISTSISEIVRCVESQRETTIAKIHSAIFAANDIAGIKSVVETEAEAALNEGRQLLTKDIQDQIENLVAVAKECEHHFNEKFSSAYSRLQAIGIQAENHSYLINRDIDINTFEIFSSMQSINQEIDNKDNNITTSGMTAGAVIGSMLLPGVGIFLGGFIGLIAASLFISLDLRKQKLWDKLKPNLDAYFDAAKAKTQLAMQTYAQSVAEALQQRIDAHVAQYQAVVDAWVNEQKTELQRLTQLQELTQTDLLEIDKRRKSLLAQQQKLADLC